MQNLYALPTEGAEFKNFCGGNLGGSNETCVEMAAIPGAQDSFILRDSKPEGAGREMRFTRDELVDFVTGASKELGL